MLGEGGLTLTATQSFFLRHGCMQILRFRESCWRGGVLQDAMLAKQTASSMRTVFAPKVGYPVQHGVMGASLQADLSNSTASYTLTLSMPPYLRPTLSALYNEPL